MLRDVLHTVMLIIASASLTGCAYMYRADDDKAAQLATKAFTDAGIGKALEAERAALTKQQLERQDLVKRSQLALRDASLARVIGGTSNEYTWGALEAWTKDRLTFIRGDAKAGPIPGCSKLLKDAKVDYNLAVDRSLLAADKLNIDLFSKGVQLKLSCTTQPTILPASIAGDVSAKALAGRYDKTCSEVTTTAQCVQTLGSTGGELGAIAVQLTQVAAEKKFIELEVASRSKLYDDQLAMADALKAKEGDAKTWAKRLQEFLERLNQVESKAADVKGNAISSRFAELGNLEKLTKQKDVLEAYISALTGKEPDNPSLGQHRVFLISNLVNRATEQPKPPTAGIMLQAEVYRLQIAASMARIKRADDAVKLIELKRSYLLDELGFLQEVELYVDDARTKGGCDMDKPFSNSVDARGSSSGCGISASKALLAFTNAWTFGRLPYEQADYRLIDQQELAALDESEAAIQQTESVVKAALEQIGKLNASGLKPEEISSLWQALGLTAIAIRVK